MQSSCYFSNLQIFALEFVLIVYFHPCNLQSDTQTFIIMKKIQVIFLYLLLPFILTAQIPFPESGSGSGIGGSKLRVAIINAKIIDVEKGILKPNQTIIIEDGLIKELKDKGTTLLPNTKIIDASGKYIMPGLVDAHIHFFQSGGLYTRPDAIDLRKYQPYEAEVAWLKEEAGTIAKRYLQAGITTVVDVGGPMYNYTIRKELKGDTLMPSVYLTGPLVSTYQPDAFKINDPPIIKVKDVEAAKALVKQQIAYAPDFIKIWYIARKPQDALDSYPIIEATVMEAKKNGLRVAIHATQLYAAKLAVKAGADLLVHSINNSKIDQEFIDSLKVKGTVYCPTLIVGANYGKVFTEQYQPTDEDYRYSPPRPLGSLMDFRHLPEPELIKQYLDLKDSFVARNKKEGAIMAANLMALVKAEIPIATGTDAGNIGTLHVSSYFEELRRMKRAGMTNAQILKASTINGAKAVGKAVDFGSIAVGKRADLLILNQNPLINIENVKTLDVVINKGAVINLPLVTPTPEELVQQQLNAYNGHNLTAFLAPFAEDVKVYTAPNKLKYQGKKALRKNYQFIEKNPDLHCELENRIVDGNTVKDFEKVTFNKGEPAVNGIATYKIKDGKIIEIHFGQ